MKSNFSNASTLDVLCSLYTFSIFIATMISYLAIPCLTEHGRSTKGLSKFYYFIFYLLSIFLLRNSHNCFVIHPFRRLIETLIYSWHSKSKMSYFQFIHGFTYFAIMTPYLAVRYVEPFGFIILNILQMIAHFRIYYLKKQEFYHYYTEILIYGYIFLCNRTCALFWNLMYIMAFVFVSIRNRSRIKNDTDKKAK